MRCPQCREAMEHRGQTLFEGVMCDAYGCTGCTGLFLDPGPVEQELPGTPIEQPGVVAPGPHPDFLDDTACYDCPHARWMHHGDGFCVASDCDCPKYNRPDGTR